MKLKIKQLREYISQAWSYLQGIEVCESCKEKEGRGVVDPYVAELYDRIEYITVCQECLRERREEI